ncbi:hypothetical protein ACSSS7_003145 [Eimeria intestinalis]
MVMVVLFGAAHGMILLPVILSWLGPMSHAHEAHEEKEGASELAGDDDDPKLPQELTAAGPEDERALYDSTKVSIPPPSLELKPPSTKLMSRPPASASGERENPRAAHHPSLAVPPYQVMLSKSSRTRDRDIPTAISSPMRRSKSAAAASRSGMGDSQQLPRHASLLSRAELLAATNNGSLKQRAQSTNPYIASGVRSQLPYSPDEQRRARRWSSTSGCRIGDSGLSDAPGGRLHQQLPPATTQGNFPHQKHRSQQSMQLLAPLHPRSNSSSSARRSSQDIRRIGSSNGNNASTARSQTYQ